MNKIEAGDKLDFQKLDELEQYILHKLFTIDKAVKINLLEVGSPFTEFAYGFTKKE